MVRVDFNTARRFLEEIVSDNKIAIFTHRDLDGFASGRLFKNFCQQKGCKNIAIFFLDYGVSKISDFDVSQYDTFLVSDLAPAAISQDLHLIEGKKVLYTDHHQEDEKYPINGSLFEFRTLEQGYIPSTRTVFELTEGENKCLEWLAGAGVLSDGGNLYPENNEFLRKIYQNMGIRETELMEQAERLTDTIVFFSPRLDIAFEKIERLKTLEDTNSLREYFEPVRQEVRRIEEDYASERIVSENKIFYELQTKFPAMKSPLSTQLSEEEPTKVYVFANMKTPEMVSLSARNQSRDYDVSQVLRDCLINLKDSNSGGHIFAAGGSLNVSDIDKFKLRFIGYNLDKAKIKNGK